MKARKTPDRRRTRRAAGALLHLESLEHRLPLAGNVTAEVTGFTLRLTGDNLANGVVVASAVGGRIAVLGINTTINGAATAFVTDRAVTAIIANLDDGDDAIGFCNSAQQYATSRLFVPMMLSASGDVPSPPFDVAALQRAIDKIAGGVTKFSIRGSLTVTTGGGDDAVGIAGDVGGSVAVDLGAAGVGNGLLIGSEFPAGRVRGSVTVAGGGQTDIVAIGNVSITGGVSAALGDGSNWIIVTAAPASTIGSFDYTGGTDTDFVGLLGNVTVRNDVSILTGAQGQDEVQFEGGVKVRGSVVVNTGTGNGDDTVTLAGDIRGSLSVTTGGGKDTVCVSSSVGWTTTDGNDPVPTFYGGASSTIGADVTIDTGEGNDLISIGASRVGRNATIDAGAGNDRIRLENTRVRRNVLVRLGAGDDVLENRSARASAFLLYGGSGANSLSSDTATRAFNRRLNHQQFQTVTNG